MSAGLLIALFLPKFIYFCAGFGSVRLPFLIGAFFFGDPTKCYEKTLQSEKEVGHAKTCTEVDEFR